VTCGTSKGDVFCMNSTSCCNSRWGKVYDGTFRTHSVYDITLMDSPSASCWREQRVSTREERRKGIFGIIPNHVLWEGARHHNESVDKGVGSSFYRTPALMAGIRASSKRRRLTIYSAPVPMSRTIPRVYHESLMRFQVRDEAVNTLSWETWSVKPRDGWCPSSRGCRLRVY
jgi:hypothetical protein